MKRTRLRSRPKPRNTDMVLAHQWWIEVARGQRCVMCDTKRSVEGHHVLSQNALKHEFPRGAVWRIDSLGAERWLPAQAHDLQEHVGGPYRSLQELLWSPANGIPLCISCHQAHEGASRRVSLDKVPTEALTFALELGMEHRLSARYYAVA